MNDMERSYLDNNATTRLDSEALDAMLPLLRDHWGNPGSGHYVGRAVRKHVQTARRSLADMLGVEPSGIVVTAGATEADNLALSGVLAANPNKRHLIVTAVEHPAVLDCAAYLESQGRCELSVIGVGNDGQLDLDALEAALRPGETALVSVMGANNETGVEFPINQIVERVHAAGALLHVDAVQLVGKSTVDLSTCRADLMAFSAHKFHGPKGVGLLALRPGLKLQPLMHGGGQEKGLRPGTENPAGIVGMAAALGLALSRGHEALDAMRSRRDRLESELKSRVPGLEITGEATTRIANTTHLSLAGVEAEALLVQLDTEGIACSAGSACSTGALKPSHVLTAMGIDKDRLHGALRLSQSHETTDAEIDRVLEVLPPAVERLRALL